MAASHADAEAEKDRLLEEQDDEGSSSEQSGGKTAVASPINRLASIDIEGLNDVDVEKEAASTQERPPKNGAKLVAWITVNTLATIGIIFTNKTIFSDPSFQRSQVSFASFHFFVTFMTLFVLSRPRFGMFTPEPVRIKTLLPLAIAMSLNVILPNASLQFSSVTFYQLARILLTPTVASINYIFYSTSIPRLAGYALIPACLGVGIVSYYDSKAPANPKSGCFASLINLSQFFIIGGAGPVSSTVVGHLKTCAIVTLGWITSGRSVGDKSIFGILLAITGIIA
ncbi:MAG: hypothetical protein Q9170_004314 [Blastenia crenularia]